MRRTRLIVMAFAAVMLLGAQASSAEVTPHAQSAQTRTIAVANVFFYPSTLGGRAAFRYGTFNGKRTHYLTACDYARDGYGIIAYVSYFNGGRQNLVAALNGPGHCAARSVAASFNRTVYLVACRYKGTRANLNSPGRHGRDCNQEVGVT